MFDIVLFNPQIAPNTGNIIRLCANSGARLHLIEPLGFKLDDRRMRRAGLDYHEFAKLEVHADFAAFVQQLAPERRIFALSTKAGNNFYTQRFGAADVFMFGSETSGISAEVMAQIAVQRRLRLPMLSQSRSMNLANTVAVCLYEAWRQLDFAGAGAV